MQSLLVRAGTFFGVQLRETWSPLAFAPTMAMLPAVAVAGMPPAVASALTATTVATLPEVSSTWALPLASVVPVALQTDGFAAVQLALAPTKDVPCDSWVKATCRPAG